MKWYDCSYTKVPHLMSTTLVTFFHTRVAVCLLVCLLVTPTACAEVITLRSGQTVRGEVVLQNEEVLIVRLPDGSRFQYPATEVVSVTQEDAEPVAPAAPTREMSSTKKVAMRATFAGGAAYIPMAGWGSSAAMDIQVGTHRLMERRIFAGGGTGVHATFVGGTSYAFVPVQAVASVPLTEARHAPIAGMAIGYGFAVAGAQQGGICASVDVGWKYDISDRSALSVSAGVQWQQARVRVTEMIEGNDYVRTMGVNILSAGVKVGFRF